MLKISNDLLVAQQIFNLMLHDGIVSKIIQDMPKGMDYINLDPPLIVEFFLENPEFDFYAEVSTYRPWNPWSAAYATTYTGNYGVIKLNSRKINRPISSLVGSIAHEWGHCLEYKAREKTSPFYFNHGDNKRKDNTFQYQLGMQAKKYVEEYEHEFLRRLAIVH